MHGSLLDVQLNLCLSNLPLPVSTHSVSPLWMLVLVPPLDWSRALLMVSCPWPSDVLMLDPLSLLLVELLERWPVQHAVRCWTGLLAARPRLCLHPHEHLVVTLPLSVLYLFHLCTPSPSPHFISFPPHLLRLSLSINNTMTITVVCNELDRCPRVLSEYKCNPPPQSEVKYQQTLKYDVHLMNTSHVLVMSPCVVSHTDSLTKQKCVCVCGPVIINVMGPKSVYSVTLWGLVFLIRTKNKSS